MGANQTDATISAGSSGGREPALCPNAKGRFPLRFYGGVSPLLLTSKQTNDLKVARVSSQQTSDLGPAGHTLLIRSY